MKGINILEPKMETQTSFEYLKNNTEEFFGGCPDIFDSDLKAFFNYIASEDEKNIDYELLSRQILIPSKNIFSFLHRYGTLYSFWIDVLDHKSSNDVKLQQVEFLKDLMNGFEVYKTIKKPKKELNYKARDLYLLLIGNQNKTVNKIFLNTPTDKHNKEIYLQAQKLFNLRGKFFKKLLNKGIIRSDSDQSDIVRQEYEESIAERTKLRKQKLDEIKGEKQNINNELFKKHFTDYQSPSKMYNALSDTKSTQKKT